MRDIFRDSYQSVLLSSFDLDISLVLAVISLTCCQPIDLPLLERLLVDQKVKLKVKFNSSLFGRQLRRSGVARQLVDKKSVILMKTN